MSRSSSSTERNSPPAPETTCSTRPDTLSLVGSKVAWRRTTNARWTESSALRGVGDGESVYRAGPAVWFEYDGKAVLRCERSHRERGSRRYAWRVCDTSRAKSFGHAKLTSMTCYLGAAEAEHVQVIAKASLRLEPMLAVGVDPIDSPMALRERGDRASQSHVFSHIWLEYVLSQTRELRALGGIRLISHAENGDASLVKRSAKMPRGRRKRRRQENDVHA